MDSNVQNFNFLKDTVNRFKNELQKLVATSKYSNTGIMKLRDNIEKKEKNIQNQEKFLVNSYLNNKKSISSTHKMIYTPSPLPLIRQPVPRTIGYIPDDDVYISVKYEKQSKLDRLKQKDFFESLKKYSGKNFYNLIRCGLAHRASVKEGVVLSKEKESKLDETPVILNINEFYNDFVIAVEEAQSKTDWPNPSATMDYVSVTDNSETGATKTIIYSFINE